MKILSLAAEVAPYVSVGGLSQVMYFLPRSLMKRGHQVRVFTAKHGAMMQKGAENETWKFTVDSSDVRVPIAHDNGRTITDDEQAMTKTQREKTVLEYGGAGPQSEEHDETPAFNGHISCDILLRYPKREDPPAYFVKNQEYFGLRANVFGYADDHTRFAFLSKACLEWLLRQHKRKERDGRKAWWPDVIHCHDWHASYFIDLARHDKRYRKILAATPILLTVHNFKYQGNADFRYSTEKTLDTGITPLAPLTSNLLQQQNALKRGLLFADAVTTVSPTHAIEVLTPEYAEGMEDALLRIRGKLSGILNGIDVEEFNPATDPIIHSRFSRLWFQSARAENKKDLQRIFSLPVDASKPMFASVGRLASQKGWDMLLQALPPLLEERDDVQLVVVGTGADNYRDALQTLQQQFPKQIGLYLQQDFRLPRKVFSGADVTLLPSVFEPGGIVALEALRYGAVPLVRRTGGLNDSVEDFDPAAKRGTGFSFVHKNPWALYGAMIEALTVYRQPAPWQRLVANCLAANFSWDHAAQEYEEWYKRAVQHKLRFKNPFHDTAPA